MVLKVLPPELAAEVNRDRFRQEVQFAARLQHPHIVPLLADGEEAGLLYYTMPYIDGESLKAEIARGRRFTEDEAVEVLSDVADALAYAHEQGLAHRDIKPGNILRSGGHAVVTDFGVAKALTAALRSRAGVGAITTSGVAIGTPAYMAPEQIAGDPAADHRVDIYAMGLLAYELLTGRAPFTGPSPQAMLAAHLTGRAEPLGALRPDLSPALVALVSRCLEKEASRRPGSASAVLEILRTISLTTGARRFAVSRAAKRWGGVAAVGVLGIAAVLSWIIVRQRQRERDTAAQLAAIQDTLRHRDAAMVAAAARTASTESAALRSNRLDDQKRLQRVTDSISAAVQQRTDSAIRQLQHAAPPIQSPPPLSGRGSAGSRPGAIVEALLTPEAFHARALNMGPPRRTFVELSASSMLKSPDVIIRAGVVRDSIIARLKASGRFRPIPIDTVQAAVARTRSFDSLAVILNTDLFISLRTSPARADSVVWQVDVRDLGAHVAYQSRGVTVRSGGVPQGLAFDIPQFVDKVILQLGEVDRAPRKK